MTLDHATVAKELAAILRHEHPGWQGDKIMNAESFLYMLARDMPEQAKALADDMQANVTAFSDITGLSPDRIKWAVNRIVERLPCTGSRPLEAFELP